MWFLNLLVILFAVLALWQIISFFRRYRTLSIKNTWLNELNGLIDKGLLNEAERYAISFIQSNPEDADLYYSLGYCAYNLNRVDEAKTNFEKALSINKNMATALYSLGYLYFYDKKQDEKAIELLENAIKQAPSFLRAYNTLAIVFDSRGNNESARNLLLKAVAKYGGDANSYNTLGLISYKLKDFQTSEKYFLESLKLEESAETLANIGNLYSLQMDYPEAIDAFKKAVKISPDNKNIRYWLGSALYLNKNYDEALTELSEAIRLDKNFAAAFMQRAQTNRKLKNEENFLSDYENAVRLDPTLKGPKEGDK